MKLTSGAVAAPTRYDDLKSTRKGTESRKEEKKKKEKKIPSVRAEVFNVDSSHNHNTATLFPCL